MKTIFIACFLLLGYFALPAISVAQDWSEVPPTVLTQIDRLASNEMTKLKEPSLAIAVVAHGKLVFAEGYGLADIENHVPATADTVYRIASVSKPLTATGMMRLVEANKLDLEAPIQKYCPAFPTKPWPITVRELLTQQSGIRHYKSDEESINTRHYTSINEALQQDFTKDPLLFEPGTKFGYSSYGYIVLGCVIEGASGTSYATYMQQSVFHPAGMTTTRLDDVFAIILHRAHGYSFDKEGHLQNAMFVDISNKPPGSGINSTARDLGNFMVALYNGRLVSPPTWKQMITPARTRDGATTIYAYGWFVGGPLNTHQGLREVGHGGDIQGFSSALYALPETQFAVAVLSNGENPKASLDYIKLARNIYDAISGK
jgi:serine beta-lactamase-like protein LACTB